MSDYIVHCRWPNGDDEYFHTSILSEATGWAFDAQQEANCHAVVYIQAPHQLQPIRSHNNCLSRPHCAIL